MDKENLFKRICESDRNLYIGFNQEPSYGDFLLLGMIQGKERNFDNNVGYVVQVRKKAGDFGTDQYLIRHSDGILRNHENQIFSGISEIFIEELRTFFKYSPKEELKENPKLDYSIGGKAIESGFLII